VAASVADVPEPASSIRKRQALSRRALRWIAPKLFFLGSYAIFRSCRMVFLDKQHEDQFLRRGLPIIFAGFHQGMLLLPYHFRDRDGIVMVSASRDGDLIADTMALFGLRAARGSSTRGGRQALDVMIEEVNRLRCSAGVIVDGPKGPPEVAKMGAITLAKATGLPIVPGNWWCTRQIRFRSWDRTVLPLPFATLAFAFTDAMTVPSDATPEEMERLRVELTERLGRAQRVAQAYCEERR